MLNKAFYKKLIAAVAALGLMASLCACSGSSETVTKKTLTSEELEHQMSGQEGRAATELVPGEEGQVEVCGSFWRARLEGQASAPKGARIVVVSSAPGDAMLLLVRPK